jgi:hypothetical protein
VDKSYPHRPGSRPANEGVSQKLHAKMGHTTTRNAELRLAASKLTIPPNDQPNTPIRFPSTWNGRRLGVGVVGGGVGWWLG